MSKLFSKSLNGVKVPHSKNTAEMETVKMPVPDKVVIPMKQHMGRECTPTVKLTDLVKVGQIIGDTDAFIGAPIHSSVSGKVTKIDEIIGTDGNPIKAVEITTDKLQEIDESVKVPEVTDLQSFAAAIRASGLVGLGGAGFPTHVKLMPKNLDEVTTLLVNGAECEPYITADNRAMLEDTDDIVEGIKLVKKYMNLSTVIIGIEDNKPQAIAKLQAAVADIEGASVKALKAQYPQGGEKVLIYECTGRIVPEGKLPSDVGWRCHECFLHCVCSQVHAYRHAADHQASDCGRRCHCRAQECGSCHWYFLQRCDRLLRRFQDRAQEDHHGRTDDGLCSSHHQLSCSQEQQCNPGIQRCQDC